MRVSCQGMQQRLSLSAGQHRPVMAIHGCTTTKRSLHNITSSLAVQSSFCGVKLHGAAMPARTLPTTPGRIGQACRSTTQRTTASFFGVGAPEALVIAVVALLVFGPKGLAEAAAGLGKTLRAFQPTIRELADVSNELKSTLEKEIGLNEVKAELQRPPSSSGSPTVSTAATSAVVDAATASTDSPTNLSDPRLVQATDAIAEAVDPDIKRKRVESEATAWGGTPPAATPATTDTPPTTGVVAEAGSAGVAGMSVEELEKELARRKAASSSGGAAPPADKA